MDELVDNPLRQRGAKRRNVLDGGEDVCFACHQWDVPIDEDDPFCPECGRQFDTVERVRRRRCFWELVHD